MRAYLLITVLFLAQASDAAAEKILFGPQKYEVKERYGALNTYKADFTASEGLFVVRLQNGDKWPERPDFLEFTLNNVKYLREARYDHPVIALFVRLGRQNSFQLMLRDAKPSGMKRPTPTPKFTYVTVVPPPVQGIEGAFGARTWEDAISYVKKIKNIKNSVAQTLAAEAAGLQNDTSARAEALRKLSDMKEPSALEFILHVYSDISDLAEVRAEAALAIAAFGDKRHINILINELANPDETIRVATARALSFYKEEDTSAPLKNLLGRLDTMRSTALMRALAEGGWRPVSALVEMARSSDVYAANTAIEILGGLKDSRATDVLLELAESPGKNDLRTIVRSLGRSADPRAVDMLIKIANDPSKRKGIELDIADAFIELADAKAADAIGQMIKNAPNPAVEFRLRDAYRKLVGRNY